VWESTVATEGVLGNLNPLGDEVDEDRSLGVKS